MPNRARRTAVLVTVLVVVAAVVAVVAFCLGRASDATPPPGTSSMSTPTLTATLAPTYSPTDVYGSPEPGLARGPVASGRGGRSTGPAGLPLGYDRTPDGAASAASNYLSWMNSLRIVDAGTADAMAGAAASDARTKAALVQSFNALRSGMTGLTADEEQVNRGAYAVASYSAARAVVYIWAPEVTTDSSGETDHVWSIDAVALVWASDDWKLDGGLVSRSGAAAVDPSDPAGNPTAAEKHSILVRTPADPGAINDSADQTWLEYADAAR